MLIVSSEIVSPGEPGLFRFFVVILTARNAVFICGDTEVIVPCTMVPFLSSIVTVSLAHFIRNLYKPCQLTMFLCTEHVRWPKGRDCADSSETDLCENYRGRGLPDELHFGGCCPQADVKVD